MTYTKQEKRYTKQEGRVRAFVYRGNASVIEVTIGPVGCIKHPNRVLTQHRSSNKSRRSA